MEEIRLQQEEAKRIREHEEKLAAEKHNREMEKLREQKDYKMMEWEMLKLQVGDAEKNRSHSEKLEGQKHEREKEMQKLQFDEANKARLHEAEMEAKKHEREQEMKAMKIDADIESKKHEETMLKLQSDEADKARMHEVEMEVKKHEREMEMLERKYAEESQNRADEARILMEAREKELEKIQQMFGDKLKMMEERIKREDREDQKALLKNLKLELERQQSEVVIVKQQISNDKVSLLPVLIGAVTGALVGTAKGPMGCLSGVGLGASIGSCALVFN